jgi:ribosomal protein S18 acetylase RimI-like enzyme
MHAVVASCGQFDLVPLSTTLAEMRVTSTIAAAGDVPLLLEMMEAFNRFEEIPWTPADGEAPLRALLADPSLGVVGLFHEDGAVIGYFVVTFGYDLEWGGRDAFLTELFLAEPLRAQGRGPALVAEIERAAKEHGARALHLMVRPENTRALRLYESQAYRSPKRIFMTKVLSS